MNSISADCQDMKNAYDKCFNTWLRDSFLKGKTDNSCDELFSTYQACVKKAIKDKGIDPWEIEKDVLNTPNEKVPPESGK